MASDKPANKAELLRFQRDGRERWEALLEHVPAERITEPGVKGDRSVKDIVAHLAAWERHATERLRMLADGQIPEPLPPPGMTWAEYEHAFNARVQEACRNRTWDEVRSEATAAYDEFLAAAEALPEAMLFALERPAWQIVAYNGYLHYLDFAVGLRSWLRQFLGVIPPT